MYSLGRWILLLCLLLVCSIRNAGAQDRLTLGLTTRTGSTSLPFVVAQEKGFFKAEGLNAIVVIMQNQVVVNGVVTLRDGSLTGSRGGRVLRRSH